MADLERVKALVRDLCSELGLDAEQVPKKKKKPVETRYEEIPGGTHVLDFDEDGREVSRQFIRSRKITRGMKEAD